MAYKSVFLLCILLSVTQKVRPRNLPVPEQLSYSQPEQTSFEVEEDDDSIYPALNDEEKTYSVQVQHLRPQSTRPNQQYGGSNTRNSWGQSSHDAGIRSQNVDLNSHISSTLPENPNLSRPKADAHKSPSHSRTPATSSLARNMGANQRHEGTHQGDTDSTTLYSKPSQSDSRHDAQFPQPNQGARSQRLSPFLRSGNPNAGSSDLHPHEWGSNQPKVNLSQPDSGWGGDSPQDNLYGTPFGRQYNYDPEYDSIPESYPNSPYPQLPNHPYTEHGINKLSYNRATHGRNSRGIGMYPIDPMETWMEPDLFQVDPWSDPSVNYDNYYPMNNYEYEMMPEDFYYSPPFRSQLSDGRSFGYPQSYDIDNFGGRYYDNDMAAMRTPYEDVYNNRGPVYGRYRSDDNTRYEGYYEDESSFPDQFSYKNNAINTGANDNYAFGGPRGYDRNNIYGSQGYNRNNIYSSQGYNRNNIYGSQGYNRNNIYGSQGYNRNNIYGSQGYNRNNIYGSQGYDRNNIRGSKGYDRNNIFGSQGYNRNNIHGSKGYDRNSIAGSNGYNRKNNAAFKRYPTNNNAAIGGSNINNRYGIRDYNTVYGDYGIDNDVRYEDFGYNNNAGKGYGYHNVNSAYGESRGSGNAVFGANKNGHRKKHHHSSRPHKIFPKQKNIYTSKNSFGPYGYGDADFDESLITELKRIDQEDQWEPTGAMYSIDGNYRNYGEPSNRELTVPILHDDVGRGINRFSRKPEGVRLSDGTASTLEEDIVLQGLRRYDQSNQRRGQQQSLYAQQRREGNPRRPRPQLKSNWQDHLYSQSRNNDVYSTSSGADGSNNYRRRVIKSASSEEGEVVMGSVPREVFSKRSYSSNDADDEVEQSSFESDVAYEGMNDLNRPRQRSTANSFYNDDPYLIIEPDPLQQVRHAYTFHPPLVYYDYEYPSVVHVHLPVPVWPARLPYALDRRREPPTRVINRVTTRTPLLQKEEWLREPDYNDYSDSESDVSSEDEEKEFDENTNNSSPSTTTTVTPNVDEGETSTGDTITTTEATFSIVTETTQSSVTEVDKTKVAVAETTETEENDREDGEEESDGSQSKEEDEEVNLETTTTKISEDSRPVEKPKDKR